MYEGELTKGMVAKLRRGTKVSYVVSNGKQHMHTVQDEASKWIIENTDNLALVLRITTLWHIGINVFHDNLLTLHDADGTKLYPVEEKAPEEPVLTLAWLRERKACDEALKWLMATVEHTNPHVPDYKPHTCGILCGQDHDAQWPLPAVIAALRKAKKWEWLNWLVKRCRDAGVLNGIQERKISTPDYPLNRVKELEAELAEARKEINRLQAKAGFWNHGYNRQAMELAAAREEIADLHGKLTVYQEANATLSSKVADARKELERWEKAFQEDRKELANLGDFILRECEFDLVDNETATDTAMRIIKTQHIELARRDRLEAGTAKNIRWFKAMAHHLLAGIDLQLEHFGTPEARAKFEKEGREDLNDGDDMNGLGLGDIDWPEDD